MQLWAGTSEHFIRDTVQNQIAGKLSDSFFRHFRFRPSPGEVQSWQNSLRAICQVFEHAQLVDHGILLEYRLPLTSKRLDCMICGHDGERSPSAVIVELKQWSKCEEGSTENLVTTWVGGAHRDVLHPSAQARQYRQYLADTHTAFYEGQPPISLDACSYLHNYYRSEADPLFAPRYQSVLATVPAFCADDVTPLSEFLARRLVGGDGEPVLDRIQASRYRPSLKLLEHVADVIKGIPAYVLLDEQLVVYETVMAAARAGFDDRRKAALIVRGGPGTGKSVIALNLMADLLREGHNAHYATGSRAFTETLRSIIGSRGAVQFKYFNSYIDAEPNDVDVLICDEAHRIRKASHNRFTPKAKRTDRPQIEELLEAAKVCVFLLDDRQSVRPNEIGSSGLIRETAEQMGCTVQEFQLEAQFRCAGSDGFVNWVTNTLGIERNANVIWEGVDEAFDFRIYHSPEALEAAIRRRSAEGNSARVTAGFCWPWSKPRHDGTLEEDVVIGDYRRPWNAKSGVGRLAPGIPKESLWAHDPNGIAQVGCVYTAQGFEFDYVGVIVGTDLVYDLERQEWVGHKGRSHDTVVKRSGERFADLVKNTYRVLLSRGLKGCYVHFVDRDTETFFRTRIEQPARLDGEALDADDAAARTRLEETPEYPFRILEPEQVREYENCVPLYPLEVAAGLFSGIQTVEPEDITWVQLPDGFRHARDLFVARVVGESMNRRIPTGSWCVFRANPQGSRSGRVVLAQLRNYTDPETGGSYTVKVYESTKEPSEEGGWRHVAVRLRPDSTDPSFGTIHLKTSDEHSTEVVAELVGVLG